MATSAAETTLRQRLQASAGTSCLTTVVVTMGAYALLEAVHHYALAGFVVPWLATLFVGLNASYVTIGLAGLATAGLGYLIWKAFVQK